MDLKKTIQNLSKINVQDLKNINISKLKSIALGQPHISLSILLVVITVIAVIFIFGVQKKQARNIKIQIPELQEKLNTIATGDSLQKEMDAFFENIPKAIDDDQLINRISEAAVANNVQILSFSPPTEINEKQAHILTVTMNISTDDYANFIGFIESIETFPFSIKISQIKASLSSASISEKAGEADKNPIQAQLEVNSVTLRK